MPVSNAISTKSGELRMKAFLLLDDTALVLAVEPPQREILREKFKHSTLRVFCAAPREATT